MSKRLAPIIVSAPQRSEEWFSARLGNVTASKVSDTMSFYAVTKSHLSKADEYYELNAKAYSRDWLGAMRENYPTQYCLLAGVELTETAARCAYREHIVAERITGMRSDEDAYVNSAMRWGITNEALALGLYEARYKVVVEKAPLMLHPELLCGASPDGLPIDKETGELGNLEIKCLTARNHLYKVMQRSAVPEEYYPQIQMQMWISGRDWCDFVAYDSRVKDGLKLFVKRVDYDEFYVDNVLEPMVRKFLEECDHEERQFHAIAKANQEKDAQNGQN